LLQDLFIEGGTNPILSNINHGIKEGLETDDNLPKHSIKENLQSLLQVKLWCYFLVQMLVIISKN